MYTSVTNLRISVMFTHIMWCSHAWVLFLNASKVWFQHTLVWFIHAECDFHTQCDFGTHKSDLYTQSVILTHTNVITTLTTVISTRTRVIFIRRVWFIHAVCDLYMHTAHKRGTHKCDYETQNCDFNTHKSDLNTHTAKGHAQVRFIHVSAISTRRA
jgi:hypothetical protein